MKKLCIMLSFLSFFTLALTGVPVRAERGGPGPAIGTHAEAHSLIDVNTGRILTHNNGDKQMRIASLTKIMTAIVAIENGDLSSLVKVSKNAFGKEGSSIYVKLGEEMSLHNMLYGLMLRSGNDAATAIAEHIGGTEEGFVLMMNEKAKQLGLANSQFRNPHGLDADGHYSSANDLAKLTAYALKNPVFKEIVKTKLKKAPNPNESWDYVWHNKNKMLSLYEGADGVKTGYTKLAHRTLVSSATRDGQQLAAVTLNDGNDWADHATLFDYGFKHFAQTTLIRKNDLIEGTDYFAGSTVTYPLLESEKSALKRELKEEPENSVDYTFGLRGRVLFKVNGETVASVPYYTAGSPQLIASERSTFQFTEPVQARSYLDWVAEVWKAMVSVW
ncbi:D-alanyl-D-alanine carboxypeptidase family protein [Paenibacillus turpanensis]|uniref:D-alanyl-D-alanine carboxypeptidase family protein n=1 Tax=Paenibacillus turpanensis TaxID=2689078 RepID=UPI00140CC0B5|nr:D-alanyl-D-alanine carboxypeptidase family protein [Paenibacillus turpanensis]